jgi:hypothetical protein
VGNPGKNVSDDAIAFIEIVIWENELTWPDKRDEAIDMINKMHGFVRSKSLKELVTCC